MVQQIFAYTKIWISSQNLCSEFTVVIITYIIVKPFVKELSSFLSNGLIILKSKSEYMDHSVPAGRSHHVMAMLTFTLHISSWIAFKPIQAVTVRSAAATNFTMAWVSRARNTGLSVASEVFVCRIRALYRKKKIVEQRNKRSIGVVVAVNSINWGYGTRV